MIFIGIDPGLKGGIALIGEGISVYPYDNATLLEVCEMLHGTDCICCLEQVHSMPKQGVSSTFKFGVGYGYIKGVLEAFRIPYQEMPPQRWKKEFSLNTDKQKSIEVCKRLFPSVSLKRTERCTTDSDGIAEALLMAEYARRKM